MPEFKNIQEVHSYLDLFPIFAKKGPKAINLGLEKMVKCCEAIGNPQDEFKSILVAGTNGKGTTCSILHSILTHGGYKTGLYTSPHLETINERIKIDSKLIDDFSILEFFNTNAEAIKTCEPSYFELLTALSFWYFAKQNVEIAIIEVGLGGRLDATNVLKPISTVITSIGLDHQQILGDTETLIAKEKAGIIKEDTPIILSRSISNEAYSSIIEVQIKNHAILYECKNLNLNSVNQFSFETSLYPNKIIQMDIVGEINHQNAETALMTLESIKKEFPISLDSIHKGLSSIKKTSLLQGRMEKLLPNEKWYFDGAHNEQGANYLVKNIEQHFKDSEITLVLAFMGDKDIKKIMDTYSRFPSLYYFELENPRSAKIDEIQVINSNIQELKSSKISEFLKLQRKQVVIFTGSFYFYQSVKEWISRI